MAAGGAATGQRRLRLVKGSHIVVPRLFEVLRARMLAQVEKDGMSVSGDSIMGLLMLTAPRGSQITVTTSGPDALPLADALEALVADYFGEGM